MMHQLKYGASSTLELDVPDAALIARPDETDKVIEDPAAAVRKALADPVNFPPLSQAVVPGDRVVLALDPEVPQAGEIVAGAVAALVDAGVDPDHITVLQAQRHEHTADLSARLGSAAPGVVFSVHDPDDRGQLAYLAASKDASPIVLNRHLCDADLVLPINLVRPDVSLLYPGPQGGLCPTFADTATQQRFQTPNAMATRRQQQRRREEAEEVAWLLGIQLTLQVIAGPGDSLLHVLAGPDAELSSRSHQLAIDVWGYDIRDKAELVVATIEGQEDVQSWENFSRALHTAQQLCETGGTIVLCTDLATPPGPALRRLSQSEDKELLLKRLGNDRSADAISAWLLVDGRDTWHVFLLSQLDEATVESLGIGYVDTPAHINRISGHCKSCILLTDAHRAAAVESIRRD